MNILYKVVLNESSLENMTVLMLLKSVAATAERDATLR